MTEILAQLNVGDLVTTVEAAQALPVGAVVKCSETPHHHYTKTESGWQFDGGAEAVSIESDSGYHSVESLPVGVIVTTPDQLESLPVGSQITTLNGEATRVKLSDDRWARPGENDGLASYSLRTDGYFTITRVGPEVATVATSEVNPLAARVAELEAELVESRLHHERYVARRDEKDQEFFERAGEFADEKDMCGNYDEFMEREGKPTRHKEWDVTTELTIQVRQQVTARNSGAARESAGEDHPFYEGYEFTYSGLDLEVSEVTILSVELSE